MGINVEFAVVVRENFWLAIVAAALCIAARLYHKKVAATPTATPTPTPTPEAPATTPPPAAPGT